jgi:2-amino-4-hydroxy-6-hydroxymethyldihydropteridine diphosphokinase
MVSQHTPGMQNNEIYLAFGSNLGDRRSTIIQALRMLSPVVAFTQISSLYETAPVGYEEQPLFLNVVCHAVTALSPRELLQQAKSTEVALGRQATFRNGPRPIDIDILLYGDQSVHEADLVIPHPRMTERAFVLVPLNEIAGDLYIPQYGQNVAELLAHVSQGGVQLAGVAPITLDLILDHKL